MTKLSLSIVAGTTAIEVRSQRSYRQARTEQQRAAREAQDRATGWMAMAARAAGAFLATKRTNPVWVDEAHHGS